MSESSIDMERCLQGVDDEKAWVPEITWNNCAEQMPPDDQEIIIKDSIDPRPSKVNKLCLDYCVFFHPDAVWYWTPYTPEKWKELNNG